MTVPPLTYSFNEEYQFIWVTYEEQYAESFDVYRPHLHNGAEIELLKVRCVGFGTNEKGHHYIFRDEDGNYYSAEEPMAFALYKRLDASFENMPASAQIKALKQRWVLDWVYASSMINCRLTAPTPEEEAAYHNWGVEVLSYLHKHSLVGGKLRPTFPKEDPGFVLYRREA